MIMLAYMGGEFRILTHAQCTLAKTLLYFGSVPVMGLAEFRHEGCSNEP